MVKSNFTKVQEIKKDFQAKKIGRFLVDATTANAILLVYNSLKQPRKTKYRNIINADIRKAADIAWKLVK